MYICYLDESGTAELSGNTNHFVYAGIAIPSETWKDKDFEIYELKKQYGLENSEIHAGWINRKYVEQVQVPNFDTLTTAERIVEVNKVRVSTLSNLTVQRKQNRIKDTKKYFAKTQDYIHLTYHQRKEFLLKTIEKIASWEDSRIFFHSIKKNNYGSVSSRYGGIYQDAFYQLVTRFQMFLDFRGKHSGEKLHGMLVCDNNESINKKLTQLMRTFHQQGTFWRDINNIIETPLFVDSSLTSMIQVADLVCYTIRRFFDNNERALFCMLYPRVDRVKGQLVGGRHFTPTEMCSCMVCRDAKANHCSPLPRITDL